MTEQELQYRLGHLTEAEKHIALSALIIVVSEAGGIFITEQNLNSLFTNTQIQVAEALKRLGL